MKKVSLLLAATLLLSAPAWAQSADEAVKNIECKTNTMFEENVCNVCYTTDLNLGTDKTEITDITIPWEYQSTGDLSEIIYSNEQKLPETKSKLTIVTDPAKPEDLWENDETLKWEPFDQYKESVITKDQKVGLYRLKSGSKMTINQAKSGDEILFVTPLTYHEFNAEISEESNAKERKICVLGTLKAKEDTTVTPETTDKEPKNPIVDPIIPAPETTTETPDLNTAPEQNATTENTTTDIKVDAPLNAAAPEPVPTVQEQTKVQTGPGLWIILLLAFVLGGAWQAYQKQKRN